MTVVKVVWKNERKIMSRVKQMELEEWLRENNCDVCAISETGLNGDEYVELGKGCEWIGANRDGKKIDQEERVL